VRARRPRGANDIKKAILDALPGSTVTSKDSARQGAKPAAPVSAALKVARSEIALAFEPQVVVARSEEAMTGPSQEATTGLSPKSSLWGALNVLDMPELYQVLQEADADGRLNAIATTAPKAEGVNNNRLLAPIDAIQLKKENLKKNPEKLKQFIVGSLLTQRLALLPQNQQLFILKQIYPDLKVATPPKPVPPKKTEQTKSKEQPVRQKEQSPSEKAKESSSFVGPIIKALAAAGISAVAIDALADTLVLIAGNIFRDVVLRIVVEGVAKVPVREAVTKIVEETLKEAGPKARVITEAVRHRVAQQVGEEVGHLVDETTKYLHL
jgi:hypothetical protein